MLVWGGIDGDGRALVDGAAYDPASDSWRRIADAPQINGRRGNQRATLGSGGLFVAEIGDVFRLLRYDIAADLWDVLPSPPIPTGDLVSLVWADGRLVMLSFPDTGKETAAKAAVYDPTSREWTQASGSPQSAGAPAAAMWTGTEVVSLSRPVRGTGPLASGAALDPFSGAWRSLKASAACSTDGGAWVEGVVLSATGAYSVTTQQCVPLAPMPEDPDRHGLGREGYSIVWTGDELIVWSGATEGMSTRMPPDGAAYRP